MQKAFFGCALALPNLTNAASLATVDEDDFAPVAMAQDDQASATENLFLGQTEANEAEQEQFWDAYLSQVHAYVEAEAADTPYWTDGYTSLSQADVDTLVNADSEVKQWGKKSGLAQTQAGIDSDTEPIFKNAARAIGSGAKKGAKVVGNVVTGVSMGYFDLMSGPMHMMGIATPTHDQMHNFMNMNKNVARLAKSMKEKGYSPKEMLQRFKEKRMGSLEDIVKLINDIPGISIPGVDLITKLEEIKDNGKKIFKAFTAVDDGTPKSCWIRSEFRTFKFGSAASCEEQKMDVGMGGVCYAKCTQVPAGIGHGVGPLCWGQCNDEIHNSCGPLCLLKTEATSCSKIVVGVTKEAISTGVHAAGGDYVGAVLGGLSVAAKLAYPRCFHFNN